MKLKDILPNDLDKTAELLKSFFASQHYRVKELGIVDDRNPYKLHLLCTKGFETIAIEIREKCEVQSFFEKFLLKSQADKLPVKIYFAMPERIEDNEIALTHVQRRQLKELGIGLFIVSECNVTEDIGTISCVRRFALDKGTTLGKYSGRINEIIRDYNKGKCVNAIRDLCEQVETANFELAIKSAKKGLISLDLNRLRNRDYEWEAIINVLHNVVKPFNKTITNDLRSLKDARNITDHWKTKREKDILDKKMPITMLQGVTLLRELLSIRGKI